MHTGPSESSILRGLLEKTTAEKAKLQEKLDSILGDLEVECDVAKSRTWEDTYYCALHGTHFTDSSQTYTCPVGAFAKELKARHE